MKDSTQMYTKQVQSMQKLTTSIGLSASSTKEAVRQSFSLNRAITHSIESFLHDYTCG